MDIRTFQPGDEAIQVALYNETAGNLPSFKAATIHEVERRTQAPDFDPTYRFFAIQDNKPVGYCVTNPNGRISFPWCSQGHEGCAKELFQHALQSLRNRGLRRVFAAYRSDWEPLHQFFEENGFTRTREMVNFIQNLFDMPTVPIRPGNLITPLRKEDVEPLFQLCPQAFRVDTPAELEHHLFENPYFGPECLFSVRSRKNDSLLAVGILITNPSYADPELIDPQMPCFRLGAFGTESMQTKRVRGLFSFVAPNDQNLQSLALDMLGQAFLRLQDQENIGSLAAQVASDLPHLLGFYMQYFRHQGSFPVFECDFGG